MSTLFNLDELSNHDLYHLRDGRGAVIVAVPRENPVESEIIWRNQNQALVQRAREAIKPRKREIEKRLIEFKTALTSMRMAQRQSRIPGDFETEPDPEEAKIRFEIDALERERSKLEVSARKFRSHLQLAMFYAHNIPPQSETNTRFDRIIEIELSDTHLMLVLQFSDELSEQYGFHRSIMNTHKDFGGCPGGGRGPISGIVRRVIPIGGVTLEVVSRPDVKLEDLVCARDWTGLTFNRATD